MRMRSFARSSPSLLAQKPLDPRHGISGGSLRDGRPTSRCAIFSASNSRSSTTSPSLAFRLASSRSLPSVGLLARAASPPARKSSRQPVRVAAVTPRLRETIEGRALDPVPPGSRPGPQAGRGPGPRPEAAAAPPRACVAATSARHGRARDWRSFHSSSSPPWRGSTRLRGVSANRAPGDHGVRPDHFGQRRDRKGRLARPAGLEPATLCLEVRAALIS